MDADEIMEENVGDIFLCLLVREMDESAEGGGISKSHATQYGCHL